MNPPDKKKRKLLPQVHEQGHRDGARGIVDCPYPEGSSDADTWRENLDRVAAFRGRGLDPNGHPAPPPHLCLRDAPQFVCNCCVSCAEKCRAEEEKEKDDKPQETPPIGRVLWAIIRIATALERHATAQGIFSSGASCPTCGALSATHPCQICGTP